MDPKDPQETGRIGVIILPLLSPQKWKRILASSCVGLFAIKINIERKIVVS